MFPLRLGAADAFARVVSFLKSARFDEATLCRTLGIPSMAEFGSVRPNEVDLASADSALLGLLVWAEPPCVGRYLPEAISRFEAQLAPMVARDGNHPCIILKPGGAVGRTFPVRATDGEAQDDAMRTVCKGKPGRDPDADR